MSICNFCHLRRIEADAKMNRCVVSRLAGAHVGNIRGVRVMVHPPDVDPEDGHNAGWFATIPEHCVC